MMWIGWFINEGEIWKTGRKKHQPSLNGPTRGLWSVAAPYSWQKDKTALLRPNKTANPFILHSEPYSYHRNAFGVIFRGCTGYFTFSFTDLSEIQF